MTSSTQCPACGAAASGRFCSECGTPLGDAQCSACHAALPGGARFCTNCGTPVGGVARAPGPTGVGRWIPYLVTGAAIAALLILVIVDRNASTAGDGAGAPMTPLGGSAPDITAMTPRERAARLYDRIMRLHQERKTDSIAFFAPMALASYAAIPDMDDDARYDMARVAMVAGAFPLARAQADTILRKNATHLLGLLLRADVARAEKDPAMAKTLEDKFVTAAARERARKLPEYEAHATEIESAMNRLNRAVKRPGL